MGDEEDALLAAIRATPEDDVPRVVYADWLDEHGRGDRAAFVRLQIRLAEMARTLFPHDTNGRGDYCECGVCQEYTRGQQQAAELLAGDHGRNWRHWAGPAVEVIPDGAYYYDHIEFDRGFVEAVTCPWAAWAEHGDAIRARHPVTAVTLTDWPEIAFGPITEFAVPDWKLGPNGRIVHRLWSVTEGGRTRRFSVSLAFSDEDMFAGPDHHRQKQGIFDRQVEAARTPAGYLSLRWPGVRFTLPPEPIVRVNGEPVERVTSWQVGVTYTAVSQIAEQAANTPNLRVSADPPQDPPTAAPDPGELRRNSRKRAIPKATGRGRFPRAR